MRANTVQHNANYKICTNARSEGYLKYMIMAEMHNLQVHLTSTNFIYHNTSLRFTIIMQVWQHILFGRLSQNYENNKK